MPGVMILLCRYQETQKFHKKLPQRQLKCTGIKAGASWRTMTMTNTWIVHRMQTLNIKAAGEMITSGWREIGTTQLSCWVKWRMPFIRSSTRQLNSSRWSRNWVLLSASGDCQDLGDGTATGGEKGRGRNNLPYLQERGQVWVWELPKNDQSECSLECAITGLTGPVTFWSSSWITNALLES